MLIAIKLLAVLLGTIAGIVAVLTDYKDKETRHLTKAGKAAIGLLILSFSVAASIQYAEKVTADRRNESEILNELKKQRELIQAIRYSTLPLAQGMEIRISFCIDDDSPMVAPYLDRLKGHEKNIRGDYSFTQRMTTAPQRDLPGEEELAQSLTGAWCEMTVFGTQSSSELEIRGQGELLQFERRRLTNELIVTVPISDPQILSASSDFLTFPDLANKRVKVTVWNLRPMALRSITLVSTSKQIIETTSFEGCHGNSQCQTGLFGELR